MFEVPFEDRGHRQARREVPAYPRLPARGEGRLDLRDARGRRAPLRRHLPRPLPPRAGELGEN